MILMVETKNVNVLNIPENLRKESKIVVSERNQEGSITNIDVIPDLA
jgi:hypothetical protein